MKTFAICSFLLTASLVSAQQSLTDRLKAFQQTTQESTPAPSDPSSSVQVFQPGAASATPAAPAVSPVLPPAPAPTIPSREATTAAAQPSAPAVPPTTDEPAQTVTQPVPAAVEDGKPKFDLVGDAVLVGPSFIEGWAVVPLEGYQFREGAVVPLANNKTYRFQVSAYLLVPRNDSGLKTINSSTLPAINDLIDQQRELVRKIRARLAEARTLPVSGY